MFQASVIHNAILSRTDSEGSDRYTFDQDTSFAINSAIDTVIQICNDAFAAGKIKPEALRELTSTKVWQTNSFSRVAFDSVSVGHEMWSLIAVYPKIKINRGAAFASGSKTTSSSFRPDVSFVSSEKSAKRLTAEQWNENHDNAFMAGNSVLSGAMQEYAYLDFSNYNSTSYTSANSEPEIEIRPVVPNQFVALTYNKYPNRVVNLTDNIELPKSLTELMIEIALNYISYKQGDNTSLYAVTAQSINQLVGLINGNR